MTAMEFRRAGRELFGGEGWQLCLARLLAVNIRTVQRWAAGQNEIPDDLAPLLAKVLEATEPMRTRDV